MERACRRTVGSRDRGTKIREAFGIVMASVRDRPRENFRVGLRNTRSRVTASNEPGYLGGSCFAAYSSKFQ